MKKILLLLTLLITFNFTNAEILPNNSCLNLNSNLWRGNFYNNRTEVKELQKILFTKYNVSMQPTGFFGLKTKTLLEKYQTENGLQVSGGLGPLTRSAIQKECGNIDENIAPNNCKIWYDGCNSCSRQYVVGPLMCTMMACIQGGDADWFAAHKPVCREYFPTL